MANFKTGPREMTATLPLAGGNITLTYGYSILWTGEDYEVTVYEFDSTDQNITSFVDRANRGTLAHCIEFVKYILRRDIVRSAQDAIIIEEEI